MIEIQGTDSMMIANNLTPAYPTHPGEVLKDEIEYRKISQRKLAEKMRISYKILNDILNCRRPITTQAAILFGTALGISASELMRMQLDCYNRQLQSPPLWSARSRYASMPPCCRLRYTKSIRTVRADEIEKTL